MEWPESISAYVCSAHSCTRNRNNDVLNEPDCNALIQFLGILCIGPVMVNVVSSFPLLPLSMSLMEGVW